VLIAACIMMAAAGVVLFVSILLAYGADSRLVRGRGVSALLVTF
jgi:hypothetical protein